MFTLPDPPTLAFDTHGRRKLIQTQHDPAHHADVPPSPTNKWATRR